MFTSIVSLLVIALPRIECETVAYRSGDETIQAQLCLPAGKGPFPALMLIHPVTGLSSWVRDQAERLASEGYMTLAIDLYRGRHGTDGPSGFAIARQVPQGRRERDADAALAFLRTRSEVDRSRIGVLGWCGGGSLALMLAQTDTGIRVAIIRYPTSFARQEVVTDSVRISRITARVLGVFGAKDSQVPMDNVRSFEGMMSRLRKNFTAIVYPEADHGFELPGSRHGRYRPQDATDAWHRTLEFLAQHLRQ